MRRIITRIALVLLIVFFLGEIIGRYMGLNRLSLYQADKDFEYIPRPNQHTTIYGNHYATNEYSMRSDPILQNDTCTILFIGDSVIYGGNKTDQDSLASSILEKIITKKLKKRIRVLNISAQSWGPDNGAAYIKKYGTFSAKLIVLVNSSHDAHDDMTFKTEIGVEPYYTKNNLLAWQTIVAKAWPNIVNRFSSNNKKNDLLIDNENDFNSGFRFFDSLSKTNHIPLLNYLHSTVDELKQTKYEKGGMEIIDFCTKNNIPIIRGLDIERKSLYTDFIHFNNNGQKFLSNILYPIILKYYKPVTVK